MKCDLILSVPGHGYPNFSRHTYKEWNPEDIGTFASYGTFQSTSPFRVRRNKKLFKLLLLKSAPIQSAMFLLIKDGFGQKSQSTHQYSATCKK